MKGWTKIDLYKARTGKEAKLQEAKANVDELNFIGGDKAARVLGPLFDQQT